MKNSDTKSILYYSDIKLRYQRKKDSLYKKEIQSQTQVYYLSFSLILFILKELYRWLHDRMNFLIYIVTIYLKLIVSKVL